MYIYFANNLLSLTSVTIVYKCLALNKWKFVDDLKMRKLDT